MKQPIIVIGMHRSGTSMLTRFISDLGVFMGVDRSENDESKFFQKINKWLLFQSGASWDIPEIVDALDDNFVEKTSAIIDHRLKSSWGIQYLGFKDYIRYGNISNIGKPWGWKDPRTTLFLPIYKNLFNNAKIIHIHRNPIDVASSLRKREQEKKLTALKRGRDRFKAKMLYYERVVNHSFIAGDLSNGLELWEFYTKKALEAKTLFPEYHQIRYETFLSNPEETLQSLTKFLGLETKSSLINEVSNKVNPSRKFAFVEDEELTNLYHQVKNRPLLKSLGYDNIIE